MYNNEDLCATYYTDIKYRNKSIVLNQIKKWSFARIQTGESQADINSAQEARCYLTYTHPSLNKILKLLPPEIDCEYT